MIDKLFELANAAHALELEGKLVAADELRAAWARYVQTYFEDVVNMDTEDLRQVFYRLHPTKE